MAIGKLTSVTVDLRNAKRTGRGRGAKILTGRCLLSANSAFNTSNVEKYFREKMVHLEMNVPSGFVANYKASTTHKAGAVRLFGVSNLSAQVLGSTSGFQQGTAGIVTSCTFVATGF